MAKMQFIADQIKSSLPYVHVSSDDNLCSNVTIRAALESKEEWSGGIFHNSSYVMIQITALTRFYEGQETVTCELISKSFKIKKKLRKYTGPISKVVEKVNAYLGEL